LVITILATCAIQPKSIRGARRVLRLARATSPDAGNRRLARVDAPAVPAATPTSHCDPQENAEGYSDEACWMTATADEARQPLSGDAST